MIEFELSINREERVTVGEEDFSVLTAIVTAKGKLGEDSIGTKTIKDRFEMTLDVGGYVNQVDNEAGEHRRPLPSRNLHPGDEIRVRIMEV